MRCNPEDTHGRLRLASSVYTGSPAQGGRKGITLVGETARRKGLRVAGPPRTTAGPWARRAVRNVGRRQVRGGDMSTLLLLAAAECGVVPRTRRKRVGCRPWGAVVVVVAEDSR